MDSISIFPPPPSYSVLFEESVPLEPPEPIDGSYAVFGELQELETGIPKLTVPQLFDEAQLDCRAELHRLHQETRQTHGELIQTVVENPEKYARLTERIGILIRNMIQIVNLMRPHQALISMKAFLQNEINSRNQALKEIQECKDEALSLLNDRLCHKIE